MGKKSALLAPDFEDMRVFFDNNRIPGYSNYGGGFP
jgi:hypothetical protein